MSSPAQDPASADARRNPPETMEYASGNPPASARELRQAPWWARWFAPKQPPGSGANVGFFVVPSVVLLLVGIFSSSIYLARRAAAVRGNLPVQGSGGSDAGPTLATFDLPEFSLTERSGKAVTLDTLKGKVWIADFVFTTCAGPCPMMTRRMANLQSALAGDADVRLLTITVDPKTDTPEVLTAYANRHRAQPEKWLFLTGEREAIYKLSIEGFKLSAIVDDASAPADHPILHSTKFVLIDRQGRIRAYYDGTSEDQLERLQADARRLAAEGTL